MSDPAPMAETRARLPINPAEADSMKKYDPFMAVDRVTISLPATVAAAVRRAAEVEETTVSSWITAAIEGRLVHRANNEGLKQLIAEYESEHGAFTEAELAEARKRLGW